MLTSMAMGAAMITRGDCDEHDDFDEMVPKWLMI